VTIEDGHRPAGVDVTDDIAQIMRDFHTLSEEHRRELAELAAELLEEQRKEAS
jgi:hypothetical protein